MAYWKRWRQSHADVVSLVLESSSNDEDTINEVQRPHSTSPPLNTEDDNELNPTKGPEFDENVLINDLNENQDFGFLEGELSSDSEAELLDDGSELEEESNKTLAQELGSWATEFQLPRDGINKLLKIIRKQGHSLPKDARTLLQTPKTVEALDKCGGKYRYYGIESGILKILEQNPSFVKKSTTVELLVNIDGVPLFKSSGTQFWPILCSFENFCPFLVALYYGGSKPNSVTEFLNDFLDELILLEESGIIFETKTFIILLKAFICDAPARAFLKCIKGHSGYHSCERCIIKGYYKSNRVMFYSINDFPLRTDADFSAEKYDEHQLSRSPLIDSNIDCIKGFCLDYMHLVCLGVVKRILWYLKQGPKECRLSARQLNEMSDTLISLSGKFPSEFARQPRSLAELERWKATEFRQFLLYSGPVVLKKVVSKEVYEHFLSLAVAISILLDSSDEKRNAYLNYAGDLLKYFVQNSKDVYTDIFVSYNVHNLLHLQADVKHFKCSLNKISAFPFENHLQTIKRLVRNAKNPIAQVTKRLAEVEAFGRKVRSANTKFEIAFISSKRKDSCFMLHNEDFAFVKEKRPDGKLVCNVVRQRDAENFFTSPCESKLINIVYVKQRTRSTRRMLEKSDLYRKAVCVPYSSGSVLFPLLHGVERRT